MQWGEELRARPEFYDRLLAEGRGPLSNEPDLPIDGEEVWEAFWVLTSSRSTGFGRGPIPFLAIDRYAERFDIDDFQTFHHLLTAMDGAYLNHVNAKDGK